MRGVFVSIYEKGVFMIILIISFLTSYNQPTWGIDNPLPVFLNHGEVIIHIREEPIHKLRAKIGVGIWNSILIGTSFGGRNLVGYGDIDWEKQPSLDLRIRVFGNGVLESVIGYNNEPIEDYEAKGVFASVGSRLNLGSFRLLLSGGGNYSSAASGADFFANGVLNLGGPHIFHIEYILGSNDDRVNRVNFGYKIQSGALGAQIDLKDVLSGDIGRQIQIFYRENF